MSLLSARLCCRGGRDWGLVSCGTNPHVGGQGLPVWLQMHGNWWTTACLAGRQSILDQHLPRQRTTCSVSASHTQPVASCCSNTLLQECGIALPFQTSTPTMAAQVAPPTTKPAPAATTQAAKQGKPGAMANATPSGCTCNVCTGRRGGAAAGAVVHLLNRRA